MRIEPDEQKAIINAVRLFDPGSEIYLFGSRIDDTKRGGDIDILLLSDTLTRSAIGEIEEAIFEQIEERKIDLVLASKKEPGSFASMLLAKPGKTVPLC